VRSGAAGARAGGPRRPGSTPRCQRTSTHAETSPARHTRRAAAASGSLDDEPRADDDPRRKAQLAGDEGDGGRELLVVADGGHEVVRGDGGGVGLAGEQRREHAVDARQRVPTRSARR
jgi:hypothetical protein